MKLCVLFASTLSLSTVYVDIHSGVEMHGIQIVPAVGGGSRVVSAGCSRQAIEIGPENCGVSNYILVQNTLVQSIYILFRADLSCFHNSTHDCVYGISFLFPFALHMLVFHGAVF